MNRTGCFLTAFMMIVATTARGGEEQSPIEALLPKELAPDVHVLCASHHFGSATVGWVTLTDESILIDCPHPDYLPKILAKIESTTGKPLKRVILTHSQAVTIRGGTGAPETRYRALRRTPNGVALEAGVAEQ